MTQPLLFPVGLGTSWRTPIHEQDAATLIFRAYELGIELFDTADVYGPHNTPEATGFSERCIRKALRPYYDNLKIITKCGYLRSGPDRSSVSNNRPEYIRSACEASLSRLGMDTLPVYMLHSIDPHIPLSDTLGVFQKLKEEGKIAEIGLSLPYLDLEQIERALQLAPITHIQTAYEADRFTPDAAHKLEKLGIAATVSMPFERGGIFKSTPTRQSSGEIARARLREITDLSPNLIPIPCTTSLEHLESNLSTLGTANPKHFRLDPWPKTDGSQIEQLENNGAVQVALTNRKLLDKIRDQLFRIHQILENGDHQAQHFNHYNEKPSRGSVPVYHFPEILEDLVQLLREQPFLDTVKAALQTRFLVLGLGFSQFRFVNPEDDEQRNYTPLHQDNDFIRAKSYNVCIPLTGYGGDYPGLEFFQGAKRSMSYEELATLANEVTSWTPIIGYGEAILFDEYLPHRRSFSVASKPRINIEARIFAANDVPTLVHPVIEI